MQAYKAAILAKEFKFLNQVNLRLDPCDSDSRVIALTDVGLKVKRVDDNLLSVTPEDREYEWGDTHTIEYSYYFGIFSNGSDWEVLPFDADWAYNSADESDGENAGTIGEQLFQWGRTPEYILLCKSDLHWTLYKMGDFDLLSHHAIRLRRAADELIAEMAATS